ncbi:MAG: tetratricopeptide repeat protein [Chitinispirillaceae bacterium]|nr:tetratricopeptide repeat protein [Chitinispirillaceae bacterium]
MDERSAELTDLQKAYRDDPENRPAALNLAQRYCDLGWFNEAIELYQAAFERSPDDAMILLEYGNTAFKKGDYTSAVRLFTRLTERHPDRIEGWNNLGIALTKCNNHENAREAFHRVLEIEPENSGALLNMGNYYFGKQEYGKARTYFERACAVRADFPDAWFNVGNACIELKCYEDARTAFEKALRYRREFPSALKNLGWVYEHDGRLAEAQQCYSEAILINKADANLYVNFGNVQVRLKKYDEAKKYFLKAVRLSPNNLHGWLGLRGYALAKGDVETFMRATLAVLPRLSDEMLAQSIAVLYDLHQIDKADELLEQADRLGRGGDLLDLQRLLLYKRQEKHPEKTKVIADRISGLTDPPDAIHRGLARYYLLTKEYAWVIACIERMKDRDATSYGLLWRAMLEQGKTVEVKREIREYIAVHPESFDTYFLLADIEAKRGNVKRAETLLVHALDHGFNDMEEIHANSVLHDIFESMTGKQLIADA